MVAPLKRWDFERAVMASTLPAQVRHILLTIAVRADWPGGSVPAAYSPSLTLISSDTGMARSTVAKYLNEVETAGWLVRQRPTVARARALKERTRYLLVMPELSSPGDGLVRDADQPTDVQGQGNPADSGPASPGDGPALVRETDQASPGDGHNQTFFQTDNQTLMNMGASDDFESAAVGPCDESFAPADAVAHDGQDDAQDDGDDGTPWEWTPEPGAFGPVVAEVQRIAEEEQPSGPEPLPVAALVGDVLPVQHALPAKPGRRQWQEMVSAFGGARTIQPAYEAPRIDVRAPLAGRRDLPPCTYTEGRSPGRCGTCDFPEGNGRHRPVPAGRR